MYDRKAMTICNDRAALADPSSHAAIIMYTEGGELTPEQEQGIQCIEGCETAARENQVVEVEFAN